MALGAKHVESPFIELGQLSTAFYFSYFIIVVPFISVLENLLIDLNLKSINKFIPFRSDTLEFIRLQSLLQLTG
jgi:uncharacterized membrane protein required for colicin V production